MQFRWHASKWFKSVFFVMMLLLVATPAYADIGVPMLFALWPASWLLLLLIIPLEAAVPVGSLGISYRHRLLLSASANTVSTLVGIPLTWGSLVFLQIITGSGTAWGLDTPLQKVLAVTVQSPWLIPYDGDLDWMIPAAAAVLCVPFFFMSVWCENLVAQRLVDKRQRPQVWRWAWQANGASYAVILLSLGMKLLLVLRQRGDI